eukprot:scaffold5209_cov35-Cyclotella_meneghiniana.AAC.2
MIEQQSIEQQSIEQQSIVSPQLGETIEQQSIIPPQPQLTIEQQSIVPPQLGETIEQQSVVPPQPQLTIIVPSQPQLTIKQQQQSIVPPQSGESIEKQPQMSIEQQSIESNQNQTSRKRLSLDQTFDDIAKSITKMRLGKNIQQENSEASFGQDDDYSSSDNESPGNSFCFQGISYKTNNEMVSAKLYDGLLYSQSIHLSLSGDLVQKKHML